MSSALCLYSSIDILPVLLEDLQVAIALTKDELANVLSAQEDPDRLPHDFRQTVIQDYEGQRAELLLGQKLCAHWRQYGDLTKEQKDAVVECEKQMRRLKKLTEQLLFIVYPVMNALTVEAG